MGRLAICSQLIAAADTAGTNYDVSFADATGAFTAKAVVAFWVGRGADGAGRASVMRGGGAGTSSSARFACATFSTDAAATSANRAAHYNSALILELDASAVTGAADLTSLGSGTFRITIDDQFVADLLVWFIVLGGDDLTAFAPLMISTTGAGSNNYTVTGFTEDATDQSLLCFSVGGTTDPDSTAIDSEFMFGAVAGGPTPVNYVLAGASNNGSGTSQTQGYCAGDIAFHRWNSTKSAVDTLGHVSAWIEDGFTVTWDDTSTGPDFFVLPLKGGFFKVGEFASSTSTGALTAQTGLGGTPNGVLLASAGKAEDTAVSDHDRGTIGAQDDDGNLAAMAWHDADAENNMVIQTLLDADGSVGDVYSPVDGSGKESGISVAFDSDGFTPTQTDADPGARFVWYWMIGSTAAAPSETVPRRALMGVGF